jgi:hypothetical protein
MGNKCVKIFLPNQPYQRLAKSIPEISSISIIRVAMVKDDMPLTRRQ